MWVSTPHDQYCIAWSREEVDSPVCQCTYYIEFSRWDLGCMHAPQELFGNLFTLEVILLTKHDKWV